MQSHPIALDDARAGPANVRLENSLESLLGAATAAGACVLATVVSTIGSTYRKPGARMLFMNDGNHIGLLSGGCLESDLATHAREVMNSGIARAVEYDMRGPDDILFGMGAGCEGVMRVLLECAGAGTRAAAALSAAGQVLDRTQGTALIVIHQSNDMALGTYHASEALPPRLATAAARTMARGASGQFDSGNDRVLAQYLAPCPHLLICGAGPDAEPVVACARRLGWRITVVDHRPGYAVAARFPGASVLLAEAGTLRTTVALDTCHAAVVMSHHLRSDEHYLRELSAGNAPGFVGLLGPAARRSRLTRDLGAVGEPLQSRLHGPVGIDIGAATPESIALSIICQIHAHLAGLAM